VTHDDRRLQEAILPLLQSGTRPLVRHFVGASAQGLQTLARPHDDGDVLG
jgi:hypothetical protein